MANERTNRQSRRAPDVGREQLLTAARAFFRSKIKHEVSRQDIARHAGVTPALLTYYFDTNTSLVLAVTQPVVDEAIGKLMVAMEAPLPIAERLKQVIVLFLDFARQNGPILDLFVEAVSEGGAESGRALLEACFEKLGLFFAEAIRAGLVDQTTDPRLLLLAMWGACRLIGEAHPVPLRMPGVEGEPSNSSAADVEFISRLILHGVAPSRE